jgi:hypothetical protein
MVLWTEVCYATYGHRRMHMALSLFTPLFGCALRMLRGKRVLASFDGKVRKSQRRSEGEGELKAITASLAELGRLQNS